MERSTHAFAFAILFIASNVFAQQSIIQPGALFSFTENKGQWNGNVLFSMMDGGAAAWFTKGGISLPQKYKPHPLRIAETPQLHVARGFDIAFLHRSNNATVSGVDRILKKSHFYLAEASNGSHENVPNYDGIVYSDVWDGVDIEYRTEGTSLRQRIHVRNAAALARIALQCSEGIDGNLAFHGAYDEQGNTVAGVRIQQSRAGVVSFSMPAVIDTGYVPDGGMTLDTEFSTYFGTPNNEWLEKIRVDQVGSCYLLGAADWPLRYSKDKVHVRFPNINDSLGFDTSLSYHDPFIAVQTKILCDGKTVEYSSYLTSMSTSESLFGDMNITPGGETYIAGSLPGSGVPVTPDAMRDSMQSNYADGFIMRLDPEGRLIYSSYLGNPGAEQTNHTITFDKQGNVWIGGTVHRASHDLDWHIWPEHLTSQAFHTQLTIENHTLAGGHFILMLNHTCDSILYGTYMPFTFSGEYFGNLAIDSKGFISLVMHAHDRGVGVPLPHLIKNAFQPTLEGKAAMYIARINPAAKEMVFGTFFSGSNFDGVWDRNMVLDDNDNIIVFGSAASPDLPERYPIPGTGPGMKQNLFIAKFSPEGALLKSSYLGGSGYDEAQSLVRDFKGNYLLLWYTESEAMPCQPDYPITHIIPQEGLQCNGTVLTILDSTLSQIKYSALMTQESLLNPPRAWQGSYHNEHGLGADSIGYVYVAGTAYDKHHPVFNAMMPVKPGGFDWAIMRMKPKLPEYDMLSLTFTIPDSIYSWRKPHSLSTTQFQISAEIKNIHPEYTVNDPSVELDFPPALKLQTIFSQRKQQYFGELKPGESTSFTWRVRVDSSYLLAFPEHDTTYLAEDIIRPIRATVRYHTRNINQSCPEMIFDKDTSMKLANDIIPFDDLQCVFPESSMVLNPVDDQDPHAMKQATVTCSFVNHIKTMLAGYRAEISFGDGMGVTLAAGETAIKPIPDVVPGTPSAVNWLVDLKKLRNAREVRVSLRVLDRHGSLVSGCEAEILLPQINGLLCGSNGPLTANYQDRTLTWDPPVLTAELVLGNHLDTSETGYELQIRFDDAPNLTLAPGQTAERTIDSLQAHETRTFSWYVNPQGSISANEDQTLHLDYRREGETEWRSCDVIVKLFIGGDSVVCDVQLPDSLRLGDANYEPFDVRVQVENVGQTVIPTTTATVTLPPRLETTDPLSVSVPSLPIGQTHSFTVSCTALRTAFNQDLVVSVVGMDASQKQFYACDNSMFIPGFTPDLSCTLLIPDTLVYDDSTVQSIPFQVVLMLDNFLDTARTDVRGRLTFTGQPMFALAPGEQEIQQMPLIPAGGQVQFKWMAEFNGGDTDTLRADIVGEFSIAQAEWRSCIHPLFLINTVWEPVGTGTVPSALAFNLSQNYPNPVRSGEKTTIHYTLTDEEVVIVRVYSVLGEQVASWQLGMQAPGRHAFAMPTAGLAPGIYQYVLSTRSGMADRKMFVK